MATLHGQHVALLLHGVPLLLQALHHFGEQHQGAQPPLHAGKDLREWDV